MVIIILTFLGIVLMLGAAFWSWNAWSSRAEDRRETATLRSEPNTMKRGIGIN
jgi:uncharacterized membrane protein YccC